MPFGTYTRYLRGFGDRDYLAVMRSSYARAPTCCAASGIISIPWPRIRIGGERDASCKFLFQILRTMRMGASGQRAVLVLDAMGVIYREPNNIIELLIPLIAESGGLY